VDPQILFPPEYPYTSGTTRVLRENFAELYQESSRLIDLQPDDLVVDIGSNDGTLLSNFSAGHRVHGVEPTEQGRLAASRGIPTTIAFFNPETAAAVRAEHGPATLVTAANVFAHIEDVHSVLDGIQSLLGEDGVFISESHYLHSVIEGLQYDTIYHEHLRYYSLHSLAYLLEMHGLRPFHARPIPSHGGSIRVYAAAPGRYPEQESVAAMLRDETQMQSRGGLAEFRRRVALSKLSLQSQLLAARERGARVFGVGAPSRASTLINYVGLDDGIIDCVVEIPGSYKIGKYIPGTLIPVLDEAKLFEEQPEYALLFSWHIADELIPKLTDLGFKGDFIIPLPEPRIVRGAARG